MPSSLVDAGLIAKACLFLTARLDASDSCTPGSVGATLPFLLDLLECQSSTLFFFSPDCYSFSIKAGEYI